MEEIAESGLDNGPGRQLRQRQFQHRIHDAAKVHQDAAVRPLLDRHGLQHLLNPDRAAHHRSGYDSFYGHHVHRPPFGFHAGLDPFPAEAVRLPGAQVLPAAPGTLPGAVRPKERSAVHIQFRLHQRPVIGHTEGGGLIPARACMDQKLVLPFPQVQAICDDERSLVQLGNGRKQHGLRPFSRHFLPVEINLMIAKGSHMQDCFSCLVRRKDLPEYRLTPLPRHRTDEITLQTVQDADSETLFRAPGRGLSGGIPHADAPPGLLPRGQRSPAVRNHHLVGRFHLPGIPEARSNLDFIGRLFHGLVRTDLPTEMRLGTVNAERLREPFAPEVVHPEGRLAGGQEEDSPDQAKEAAHGTIQRQECRLRASSGASPDGKLRPP